MSTPVRIDQRVVRAIRKHALGAYPEECCGILTGRFTPEGIEVRDAVAVDNRSETHRERHYTIDAATLHSVTRQADRDGLDVVGFYHSHPDHPAEPSPTDLAEASFPNYAYLIQSVSRDRTDELTAWVLSTDRSRFQPLSIESLTTTSHADQTRP